jgi:GxxExxY protein
MNENKIAEAVVDIAFIIHRELGHGFFESVYEELLFDLLVEREYKVFRQVPLPVYFRKKVYNIGFKADLVIEDLVIVELKSVEKLHPVHFKQLLNYLKVTKFKLGLLINFNEEYLKNGIKRIVNGL